MNPTIITFPTITNPASVDWKLMRMDASFTSPLSGARQDIVRPGAYWSVDMSWHVLSYSDSQKLAAWAAMMSRGGVRSLLPNYAYTAQGSLAGTPVVNGANQSGLTLATKGWTASQTGVFKAGDMFEIYAGTITFVTAPANTYAITFNDYYGNSYTIGTGNGSTTAFNLPSTFFTGYSVYVNGVLQTYTTNYTTTMQHQLLMVTQDANSDSSGDATLNIEPALRISPADSNSLITSSPSAVFAFSKANSNMSYTAPRIAAFSMALTEDLLL